MCHLAGKAVLAGSVKLAQGDHSPGKPGKRGKPGKVREFQSGLGKVLEKVREKSG